MFLESPIFDGEYGLLEFFGNFFLRNPNAALRVKLVDEFSASVVKPGNQAGFDVFERFQRGQGAREKPERSQRKD